METIISTLEENMTDFAYLGAAQKIAKRNPEAVACRRDGRAFLHQALLATAYWTAVAMTGLRRVS